MHTQYTLLCNQIYSDLFMMSDCNGPGCSRSRGNALLCGVKPRHVRSLNFGQSILELGTVDQRSVPNRVLVIDENVARIPCTEKEDYVRKWLEIHEDDRRDPVQLSPVLKASAKTTAFQRSPILSNGRKRLRRRRSCMNRNAVAKRPSDGDHQGSAGHFANYMMRSNDEPHCKEKSEKWKSMSEIQHAPSDTEKVAVDETSPVLGKHRVFRKKRRKLQYEIEDVSPECSKLRNSKIASTTVKSIMDDCNNLREMLADRDKSERNLDTKTRTFVFSTEARESPEKYQRCIEASSSSTQERLSFADSSSNNADKNEKIKIETGTSNGSEDEECDKLISVPVTCKHGSNNNLSNLIEDVETQETSKTSQLSIANKYLIPSVQPFTSLRLTVDDSDETYCSEAEMMQDQSTRLSTRISEVQSLNKTTQKTGSKSTQTDAMISTITTPSKKSPERGIYAHLLDSGKKRRKPKKGSMAARLHSLINAQVSGIRIWRHRMNKEHEATSARYISVLVRHSTKQFGNQFLEGVLIEDRFNLLQSDVQVEQAEAHNTQVQLKGALYRSITIMLVCDIVGTLKMKSEVVINVYPPWNILDKDDLTLEAIYISVNDNCEIPDVENTGKSRERKKRILKEFNCPCIEEQRELPFCARKPSSDKPDVMQQIFNF